MYVEESIVHSSCPSRLRMFATIRSQYGTQVLQLVRFYIDSGVRLVRQKEQLTFNIRCKHLQLLPSSLRIKPLVKTPEGYKIARETSFRFLRARINENVQNPGVQHATSKKRVKFCPF